MKISGFLMMRLFCLINLTINAYTKLMFFSYEILTHEDLNLGLPRVKLASSQDGT